MNRLTFKRYFVITVFLILITVSLVVAYLRRPQADVSPLGQNAGPAVIWGKVTDANGSPLPDIIVMIGSNGAVTGPAGSYVITTDEIGPHPVQFKHRATNDLYFESSHGETVFAVSGQSTQYDFQIERSANQPTPIAVVGTSFATPTPITTSIPQASPISTASPVPKPAQPTRLTSRALRNPSRVELKWRDNATNESGFTIIRTEAKTFLVTLIDVSANTTAYTDTTVEKGKTYFYRIRAYSGSSNAKSYSALSNQRKIKAK